MPEEKVIRKLSAIMFTDMVSYSQRMGQDEEGTLKFMARHDKLIQELALKFDGSIKNKVGDAFLVDFNSAVHAVKCAMEIQKNIAALNQDMKKKDPGWREILLRIGIHLGDIIVSKDSIYGDGVNIAARIQPIAKPGGICISQDVYNQVKSKIDLHTLELGPQELKNIAQKVSIYRIILDAFEGAAPQPREGRSVPWPAILLGLAGLLLIGWIVLGRMHPTAPASAAQAPVPTQAPVATATAVPAPPTAVPAPPKEAPPSHPKTRSENAPKKHVRETGEAPPSGNGLSGSIQVVDGVIEMQYNTKPNAVKLSFGQGGNIADLSKASAILFEARSLQAVAMILRLSESGAGPLGSSNFQGANGADGERYLWGPYQLGQSWVKVRVPLSAGRRDTSYGNQFGNGVIDLRSVSTVDLYLLPNQGAGQVYIRNVTLEMKAKDEDE